MDDFLLASRLILAAVFLLAGITKLTDRERTAKAIEGFGIPALLVSPLAIALPIAELAVALALLPQFSAWWGAAGALVLLLAFTVGVAVNLVRGKTPDCHCFGQLHSKPIGWETIARNAALSAAAVFIVSRGPANAGPGVAYWFENLTGFQNALVFFAVVLLVGLILQGWMLLHLFRQNGRLMLRMESLELSLGQADPTAHLALAHQPAFAPQMGLSLGSPAPEFELPTLDGKTASLKALLSDGRPSMLIFSDPGCGPCTSLLPDIARWQAEYKSTLNIALVSRGTADENLAKIQDHPIANLLLQRDREIAGMYQSYGTPSAVIVNADGTIGSRLVGGSDAITELVRAPAAATMYNPAAHGTGDHNGHNHAVPVAAQIGEFAPHFELPDLDGKTVRLDDFKDRSTLLLFWNPACGFCTEMVDDIKKWEAHPPEGAPELIVVSTGSAESGRAHGFRSTVVIDPTFSVAPLFGVGGTPSGVLVSPEGRIASAVAKGGPRVMELSGLGQNQVASAPM